VAIEIARTFAAMAELPTPSVCVCVGEGGSGGAMALAATDRMLMCEHSVFSVIGPEGAAAIIDRDIGAAPVLASQLALTSTDVTRLGIADAVVPDGGPELGKAVAAALGAAAAGDRVTRLDRATAKWLR
jgi:acetyl-CoA carboxylase carboxyl transferase subunit beta